MRLRVAVQMDPIERINIRGDSTFALLLEAQRRNHEISYYTPDRLALRGARLFAAVQALHVRDTEGDHFSLGGPASVSLDEFDVVRTPRSTSLISPPPICLSACIRGHSW